MRGASSRPRFGPPKEISSYTPDHKTSGRFNPQPEADSNTLLRFFGSLRLTTAAIHAAGQEEFPRLREMQGPECEFAFRAGFGRLVSNRVLEWN